MIFEGEEKLRKVLSGFDWWYEMSDDHRVYCSGYERWKKIQNEIDALIESGVDQKLIIQVYNEYAPNGKKVVSE